MAGNLISFGTNSSPLLGGVRPAGETTMVTMPVWLLRMLGPELACVFVPVAASHTRIRRPWAADTREAPSSV